jgi:hypothetical protein
MTFDKVNKFHFNKIQLDGASTVALTVGRS